MSDTIVIDEENLDGIVQCNPVVFAACDSLYFMKHGEAFVRSVTGSGGMPCHVHIVNPSPMVYERVSFLMDDVDEKFTCTFEELDTNGMTDDDRVKEYRNSKHKNLPVVLANAGKVLVLNIDSIVMNTIVLPDSLLAVSGDSTNPNTNALYIDNKIHEVSNVLAWYAHERERTGIETIEHMALELHDEIQWLGQEFISNGVDKTSMIMAIEE
ncbi:hypothetical protein N9F71_00305 [bacterium]|nr:hypothetical protein [bacterium]